MQRSLERVVERVREEQVRKLIREQEETNVPRADERGARPPGISAGSTEFLEKVYEILDFRLRFPLIFDFMVPEPASYVWYLENSPDPELALPTPPPQARGPCPPMRPQFRQQHTSSMQHYLEPQGSLHRRHSTKLRWCPSGIAAGLSLAGQAAPRKRTSRAPRGLRADRRLRATASPDRR